MNQKSNRRSLRLQGFDYSQPGAYFVTICTLQHQCIFGRIVDGDMHLNKTGFLANEMWQAISTHIVSIKLDAFVVMPNHIHGILIITEREISRRAHTSADAVALPPIKPKNDFGKLIPGSLSLAIRSFKSAVTHHANRLTNIKGRSLWQRNYWEHLIRNEADLNRIREYIQNNPAQWELDRLNPDRGCY